MADWGEFFVMNPTATGGEGGGGGTTVGVPGNATAIVARAADADFDVVFVDANTVTLTIPSSVSSQDDMYNIATQLAYVFGVVSSGDLGWLTVTAKGILVLADSSDAGGAPDYIPVIGTVSLTPTLSKPTRRISTGEFVPAAPVVATLDSDGELSYDGQKNVRILAPQWSDLSNTTWRWAFEVRPGPGQSWSPFSGSFTGTPGTTINLSAFVA